MTAWLLMLFLSVALGALIVEECSNRGALVRETDAPGWRGRHLATERGTLAAVVAFCGFTGTTAVSGAIVAGVAHPAWVRLLAVGSMAAGLLGVVLAGAHAVAAARAMRMVAVVARHCDDVVALGRRDMMILDMEDEDDHGFRAEPGAPAELDAAANRDGAACRGRTGDLPRL